MKFLVLPALLLAAVSANPTPNIWRDESLGLEIRGTGDQGDGFYSAVFNAKGVANVVFTPLTELNVTAKDLPGAMIEGPKDISKRDSPRCSGEWARWQDLDVANVALANNAATRGDYNGFGWNGGHWGWVHVAGVTAFFCPYGNAYFHYSTIINFNVRISNDCGGSSALGFMRANVWRDDEWYNSADAAVGRTYRGRNFCTTTFRG